MVVTAAPPLNPAIAYDPALLMIPVEVTVPPPTTPTA